MEGIVCGAGGLLRYGWREPLRAVEHVHLVHHAAADAALFGVCSVLRRRCSIQSFTRIAARSRLSWSFELTMLASLSAEVLMLAR